MYLFLHGILEDDSKNYKFFEPSDNIQADASGISVYLYAKTQMQHRHNALSMETSLADMFQTLYAGMVIQVAFPQAGSPR
jgi:hypothetical protein